LDSLIHIASSVKDWANKNAGFVAILLFLVTLLLGWVSGIFRSLRRKPKIIINSLPGPTFCCTLPTGRISEGHETHLTAIALYLDLANVGSAPTSISSIHVGYHNYSLKYTFLWYWLKEQTIALCDFHVTIGENVKVYPFLTQIGQLLPQKSNKTYLREGEGTNGVVYFEQPESWGGWLPRSKNGITRLKIRIIDSYGHKHYRALNIPILSIEEARKYNPAIGQTRESMSKEDSQGTEDPNNSPNKHAPCSRNS